MAIIVEIFKLLFYYSPTDRLPSDVFIIYYFICFNINCYTEYIMRGNYLKSG